MKETLESFLRSSWVQVQAILLILFVNALGSQLSVCDPSNVTESLECSDQQWSRIQSEIYAPQTDLNGSTCQLDISSCNTYVYDTDMAANCNGPTRTRGVACREEVDVGRARGLAKCLQNVEGVATLVQYDCIDGSKVMDMCQAKSTVTSDIPFYLASPDFPQSTPGGKMCTCHIQGSSLKISAVDINVRSKLPWDGDATDNYSSVFSVSSGGAVLWTSNECAGCTTTTLLNTNLFLPFGGISYQNVEINYSDFGLPGQNVWVEVFDSGPSLNISCNSSTLPLDKIITTSRTTATTSTTQTTTERTSTAQTATVATTTTLETPRSTTMGKESTDGPHTSLNAAATVEAITSSPQHLTSTDGPHTSLNAAATVEAITSSPQHLTSTDGPHTSLNAAATVEAITSSPQHLTSTDGPHTSLNAAATVEAITSSPQHLTSTDGPHTSLNAAATVEAITSSPQHLTSTDGPHTSLNAAAIVEAITSSPQHLTSTPSSTRGRETAITTITGLHSGEDKTGSNEEVVLIVTLTVVLLVMFGVALVLGIIIHRKRHILKSEDYISPWVIIRSWWHRIVHKKQYGNSGEGGCSSPDSFDAVAMQDGPQQPLPDEDALDKDGIAENSRLEPSGITAAVKIESDRHLSKAKRSRKNSEDSSATNNAETLIPAQLYHSHQELLDEELAKMRRERSAQASTIPSTKFPAQWRDNQTDEEIKNKLKKTNIVILAGKKMRNDQLEDDIGVQFKINTGIPSKNVRSDDLPPYYSNSGRALYDNSSPNQNVLSSFDEQAEEPIHRSISDTDTVDKRRETTTETGGRGECIGQPQQQRKLEMLTINTPLIRQLDSNTDSACDSTDFNANKDVRRNVRSSLDEKKFVESKHEKGTTPEIVNKIVASNYQTHLSKDKQTSKPGTVSDMSWTPVRAAQNSLVTGCSTNNEHTNVKETWADIQTSQC